MYSFMETEGATKTRVLADRSSFYLSLEFAFRILGQIWKVNHLGGGDFCQGDSTCKYLRKSGLNTQEVHETWNIPQKQIHNYSSDSSNK